MSYAIIALSSILFFKSHRFADLNMMNAFWMTSSMSFCIYSFCVTSHTTLNIYLDLHFLRRRRICTIQLTCYNEMSVLGGFRNSFIHVGTIDEKWHSLHITLKNKGDSKYSRKLCNLKMNIYIYIARSFLDIIYL